MPSKAMTQSSDSSNPSAPQDTPLYAIFQDGEWFFVDQDIWDDLIIQGDEYAFTCETCHKPLSECEC